MKTAISLPDSLFDRVTHRAADLGQSRSEFLAQAAHAYLDALDSDSTTRRIDAALAAIAGVDESTSAAVAAGRATLSDTADEW